MVKLLRKVCVLLVSVAVIGVAVVFYNSNHDYILVHANYSSGAVKVENKFSILSLSQRLRFNLDFGHACGYHTAIKMIDNHKLTAEIPFNVECEAFFRGSESINKEVRAYYKQSMESPTHKVYNLIISVENDFSSVLKTLEDENVEFLFIDGELNQFPVAKITSTQVSILSGGQDRAQWVVEQSENERLAVKKIEDLIERVQREYPVVEVGEISNPMSGFGATIEHKMSVEVYFEITADLSLLKAYVESIDGVVEEFEIPTVFSIPILVGVEEDINGIVGNLDFVIKAVEYPNRE